jgi:hypothetical protein
MAGYSTFCTRPATPSGMGRRRGVPVPDAKPKPRGADKILSALVVLVLGLVLVLVLLEEEEEEEASEANISPYAGTRSTNARKVTPDEVDEDSCSRHKSCRNFARSVGLL